MHCQRHTRSLVSSENLCHLPTDNGQCKVHKYHGIHSFAAIPHEKLWIPHALRHPATPDPCTKMALIGALHRLAPSE